MLKISEGYVAQWPVFVAQLDDEIVGFYGLRESDGILYLTDLWVLPPHIGSGLGRQLWNHAVDQVRGLKREAFLIAADPNAERFYLRMGARRVGETDGGAGRQIPLMRFDLSDR
jgi:GNAT superfamily N-acetyltransferase